MHQAVTMLLTKIAIRTISQLTTALSAKVKNMVNCVETVILENIELGALLVPESGSNFTIPAAWPTCLCEVKIKMLEFHEHQQEKSFTCNTVYCNFLLLKINSQILMNIDKKIFT